MLHTAPSETTNGTIYSDCSLVRGCVLHLLIQLIYHSRVINPSKDMAPMNVALPDNRICADVIKLRWDHRGLERALILTTNVFIWKWRYTG